MVTLIVALLNIGRNRPYAIGLFLFLILIVALPFLLLGKKIKSLYPYNEKIEKKLRDFLVALHVFGSVVFAIILTKYLQNNVSLFSELYEENDKLIPVTFIILVIINSIAIGIFIEQIVRRIK
jgi:hypothetical protein